jgi:uncharacterized damage-inducible protein DinB
MNAEQAKFLTEYLAGLIERESAATAKVLAAVPDTGKDYKPDTKSRTAWQLATHLATSDVWFLQSVIDGAFAWNPDAATQAEAQFKSVKDVVAFYEREVPARLAALRALPGDALARSVDFFGMMQQPAAWFVGMANNHSTHHRGQLAAYLRAMGSKVPPIYGDSADYPLEAASN